jgi:hypothetical protein
MKFHFAVRINIFKDYFAIFAGKVEYLSIFLMPSATLDDLILITNQKFDPYRR